MALDELLIEILVDPEDKQPLWYFEEDEILYNPRLQRRYEIRKGIPVLLVTEATHVDDATAAQISTRIAEARITGRAGT